jgi:RNA polymerase sigma factor (sigma-70 family)
VASGLALRYDGGSCFRAHHYQAEIVRYADEVQDYVESIVRDCIRAEDITQEVFAQLITAIAGYERREGPFAAWLLRVARDAALEQQRSRRDTAPEKSA